MCAGSLLLSAPDVEMSIILSPSLHPPLLSETADLTLLAGGDDDDDGRDEIEGLKGVSGKIDSFQRLHFFPSSNSPHLPPFSGLCGDEKWLRPHASSFPGGSLAVQKPFAPAKTTVKSAPKRQKIFAFYHGFWNTLRCFSMKASLRTHTSRLHRQREEEQGGQRRQ